MKFSSLFEIGAGLFFIYIYVRIKELWFGLYCLVTLVPVRTFGVMYDLTFYANRMIKYQATHKESCQPGD